MGNVSKTDIKWAPTYDGAAGWRPAMVLYAWFQNWHEVPGEDTFINFVLAAEHYAEIEDTHPELLAVPLRDEEFNDLTPEGKPLIGRSMRVKVESYDDVLSYVETLCGLYPDFTPQRCTWDKGPNGEPAIAVWWKNEGYKE